ncbi:hypothetical protein [Bradyrhizobium sp. 170]|uniref:hypothetical protein n=1 Tax=Bradyrhizobium sp. 170 TaxID=2782641 RepID=UPI0020003D1D|nr:hypothetical protein [Bradyrhizobium sp. 170]UPK00893.1 hypothetical protein IVB05_24620 [Bradyrhizobium sp. 170]
MTVTDFKITQDGEPQTKFTKWFAKPAGSTKKFFVAYTVPFSDGDGTHKGLAQTKFMNELPALFYDRHEASNDFGLWSHFIWPTVVAESAGGHHLLVNTYDRARFTFGFYQLAAHTPDDNLILLFRKLIGLPTAQDYFPDLTIESGRLHRVADGRSYSLEEVTTVHRPNGKVEDQLVSFMTYLNPDTTTVGDAEALNTAKLMHWLLNEQDAVKASVSTALDIMRRKVKRLASTHDLVDKQPELAIWVSDITHQGRGSKADIKDALKKPTLDEKLDALFEVGAPEYLSRRRTVRNGIKTLMNEGVFESVVLGDDKLPLP